MKYPQTITTSLGDLKIFALNDFTEEKSLHEFFPSLTPEDVKVYEKLYPNRLHNVKIFPWTYYCYLIQDKDKNILIDTGVGGGPGTNKYFDPSWRGKLLCKLEEIHVSPADIDFVVTTHIHPDHVGWNTALHNGVWERTFPNAKYLAHRADYDAYITGNMEGVFPGDCFEVCVQPLYEQNNLCLIDEPVYPLTDSILLKHIPGHTPGSMCIILKAEEKTCILTGDIFASPFQVTYPDTVYVWDFDKSLAAKGRNNIISSLIPEGGILGSCHFGIGTVFYKNGRYYWNELSSVYEEPLPSENYRQKEEL